MSEASFQARIVAWLGNKQPENPDAKHNTGRLLGEAFFWDHVCKMAKARSDAAWDKLLDEGLIERPEEEGMHSLLTTPSFTCIAKVSKPVRRFSADELAKLLKKQHKIPEPVTKQLVEQAKVSTKPSVSYEVTERV